MFFLSFKCEYRNIWESWCVLSNATGLLLEMRGQRSGVRSFYVYHFGSNKIFCLTVHILMTLAQKMLWTFRNFIFYKSHVHISIQGTCTHPNYVHVSAISIHLGLTQALTKCPAAQLSGLEVVEHNIQINKSQLNTGKKKDSTKHASGQMKQDK